MSVDVWIKREATHMTGCGHWFVIFFISKKKQAVAFVMVVNLVTKCIERNGESNLHICLNLMLKVMHAWTKTHFETLDKARARANDRMQTSDRNTFLSV